MSKKNKENSFTCLSCGAAHLKWFGRCPLCGEWNAIVEAESAQSDKIKNIKVVPLSSIRAEELNRIKTDMYEFNLVCGGGIVPGSVILISGEPGIGKSTLALQIARNFRTLYVSGEESAVQIKHRSERLKINAGNILVSSNTNTEEIAGIIDKEKPEFIIVDSIQTLYSSGAPGTVGSVSQIKESSSKLIQTAKSIGVPVVLIGHITKDGSIAGPKVLEHLVDTVLYFEGDFSKDFRIIRAFKNRFGSVNEIGLFRMTETGLIEVKDKNSIFLNSYSSKAPGSAISAAIEGSRTILFEVQSLVAFTSFSNPRRMSDGFDYNRLVLLAAVLEKHGFLKLNSHDVFINVAGGFQINETSADLAVAVSIVSSLKEQAIPHDTGFLGEISLSGEIRPVSQCRRRILEFARSGFNRIVVSHSDHKEAKEGFDGELIEAKTIYEAIDLVFT